MLDGFLARVYSCLRMKLRMTVGGKGNGDGVGFVVDLAAQGEPNDAAGTAGPKTSIRLTSESETEFELGKTYIVDFTEAPAETEAAPVQAETPAT